MDTDVASLDIFHQCSHVPLSVAPLHSSVILFTAGTKKKKLWTNNGSKTVQHTTPDGNIVDVKRIYYICCDKTCSAKLIVKRCLKTNEVIHDEARAEHTCGFIEN